MKKIIAWMLIVGLIWTLFAGCRSKSDQAEGNEKLPTSHIHETPLETTNSIPSEYSETLMPNYVQTETIATTEMNTAPEKTTQPTEERISESEIESDQTEFTATEAVQEEQGTDTSNSGGIELPEEEI